MKKKTDYSKLTDEELTSRMKEHVEELDGARLKMRMGQFRRTSEFSRLRKEIARAQTALSARKKKAGAK